MAFYKLKNPPFERNMMFHVLCYTTEALYSDNNWDYIRYALIRRGCLQGSRI